MFFGAMKAIKAGLKNVLPCGTDGEEALVNALEENFERSTHLLCFNHLKKNIDSRLVEMGITGQVKKDILADIFGRHNGDLFEIGLVDAISVEIFEEQMNILKRKWTAAHINGCNFHELFEKKWKIEIFAARNEEQDSVLLAKSRTRFSTNDIHHQ